MKIKYFICAAALLTGSLQAVGQTYSGTYHCSATLNGATRPEVNVTAELVIRKGFAQLRRGNQNYEELSEGRLRSLKQNTYSTLNLSKLRWSYILKV